MDVQPLITAGGALIIAFFVLACLGTWWARR